MTSKGNRLFIIRKCNRFFDSYIVKCAADESREGEIQELCGMFEFQFFDFRHSKLDEVRFVVRRVVVLGRAGGCDVFIFLHCTSCLFDNSSVKLCKHDTPLLFAPSGANYEQGLGQARPNKITSEMQTHCRSEVPVEHKIFKN